MFSSAFKEFVFDFMHQSVNDSGALGTGPKLQCSFEHNTLYRDDMAEEYIGPYTVIYLDTYELLERHGDFVRVYLYPVDEQTVKVDAIAYECQGDGVIDTEPLWKTHHCYGEPVGFLVGELADLILEYKAGRR